MSPWTKFKKSFGKKQKYTKKVYKKPVVTDAVKAYVSKRLSTAIENKNNHILSITPVPLYQYINNTAVFLAGANVFGLTPGTPQGISQTVAQSTGQGGRIGNNISVKRQILNMIINPKDYVAGDNPTPRCQNIRIMIFKMRGNYTLVTDLSSDFFQDGGSAFGLTSRNFDMIGQLNKDTKVVYRDFQIKIGPAINTTSSGGTINNFLMANNDYKYNERLSIDCTDYIPKKLVWDDASATANVDSVYCVISPCNADGSVAILAGDWPLEVFYDLHLTYEDA